MEDKKNNISIKKLKEWLGRGEDRSSSKTSVPLYLGILLLAGIIFMAAGAFTGGEEETESLPGPTPDSEETSRENPPSSNTEEIEKEMQNRLQTMLGNISGVQNVTVMLTLQRTEKNVYEKDRTLRQQTTNEEDQEGGTRVLEEGTSEEQLVIVQQDGEESPLLLYKEKPKAKGVLVVADGVEDLEVKEWVVEAVTRVLDIAPHKVSVLPKDQTEGE
ncbi:stage III sporulation protein AG [Salibacterium sp. K-3]